MAPKKGQKMSLGAFLEDSNLGSWADEMDSFPSAPAQRGGDIDSQPGRLGGRAADSGGFGRSDRTSAFPPREDLPLPTQPPYTAFVGNLAFDLAEADLEQFFSPLKTKSIKIIKDRDDRPKGFGYIEFEDLDGLKDAISRTGQSMAGRTVRVSVAEPPKSGFGGMGGGDDEKFASPWRRDGPLPDLPGRGGDSPRRRFEGERAGPLPSSVSDNIDQWRSSRPSPRIPPKEFEPPPFERKRSGFPEREAGLADTEDTWSKGSRFKPSEEPPSRGFGSGFRRQESAGVGPRDPPPPSAADEPNNWRSARPTRLNSQSPTTSTPPTPQMGRRKLELMPRTGPSAASSPLSSPRMGPASSGTNTPRSNPFGDAKPVDLSAKDKEITERVEKDRESVAARVQHTMSRTSSKGGLERTASKPGSPRAGPAANVRPTVSFASALGNQETSEGADSSKAENEAAHITEKLSHAAI